MEEIIGNQRLILGDSSDIIEDLVFNVLLTDPPYGIQGSASRKGDYQGEFEDNREYIKDTIVPIVELALGKCNRGIVTPGYRNMLLYPEPVDIGCFYTPASTGCGPWGFNTFNPIYYYGKNPYAGKGRQPTGKLLTEVSPKNGHPCPKPIKAWTWLLSKVALDTDTVLDPFLGSGTTLVACELTGRRGIGVEIDRRFFDIACREVELATKQLRLEIPITEDMKLF
jgi:DNA modification methylase